MRFHRPAPTVFVAFTINALALIASPPSRAAITDGLVAYWSFDSGFQATAGGAGLDATPVNGPVIDAAGRFGTAVRLVRVQSQYLDVNAPVITQGHDHTYSAWYRSTVADITGSNRYFVLETRNATYSDGFSVSYGLRDQGTGDKGEVLTQISDGTGRSVDVPGGAGTNWHNIITTYDASNTGAEHTIYLDGALLGYLASGPLLMDTAGLIIGGRTGTGRNWDGWIDDVAFWNRVITADEIARIQAGPVVSFTDVSAGLTGVYASSARWGDYDADGDLDVLLSGWSASGRVAKVYANTGAAFSDIGAGLIGVAGSSAAWGDYDNDGDLDILLTGHESGYTPVAKVYANTGGAFSDIGAGLTGVAESSAAWGDYDNDGDLDILLAGGGVGGPVSKVYANTGGVFSDIGAGLTGVFVPSVAWGDYDNDGDLDLLLTGYDSGDTPVAKVYANTDGAFSDIGAGLTGVAESSAAWGDYDNDGDLDILLTGLDLEANPVTMVYANNGGAFSDIGAGLTGVRASSVGWGDYDNDGDLDILLTGSDSGYKGVAKVYANRGGTFSDIGAVLTRVWGCSVAWGDFDNDGDLDILLTGNALGGLVAKVYENPNATPNTPPSAPGNLAAAWAAGTVTLSWDAASDTETPPAGLSYNLRVGTTPGGSEITAGMADNASGYRHIPALGNANHNLSWTVDVPVPPVYWSVQAIDGAWAGSPFAPETSEVTGVDGKPEIPVAFALRAGVPNPFRSNTQIRLDLPSAEPLVVLEVFDISGRLVRTLHRAPLPAGTHTLRWDGVDEGGRNAAAGVYLYRLRAGTIGTSRSLVLIR